MSDGEDDADDVAQPDTKAPQRVKGKANADESPDIRAVRGAEDRSLRDVMEGLGSVNFEVIVDRLEPSTVRDPATGKVINVGGHLRKYQSRVDEEIIQRAHGGGTYRVRVMRQDKSGAFRYFAQRQVSIAGEVNLEDPCLHRNQPQPQPTPQTSQQESNQVNGVTEKLVDAMLKQQSAPKVDRGSDDLVRELTAQLASAQQRMVELASSINRPVDDPFKDRLITTMFSEESARIAALRAQFDSEIRSARDNHRDELRRVEDRYTRMMQDSDASHAREIQAIRQAYEMAATAVKQSQETQDRITGSEIRRLESQLAELRETNRALQERVEKSKSIVDQAKDLQAIKEALGVSSQEDDGGGLIGKLAEIMANAPAAVEMAKGLMGKPEPAQQAPQQVQRRMPPAIVRGPDGRTYAATEAGLVPVKPKKKVIQTTNADGTPGPELPVLPEEQCKQIISLLEGAFAANSDPEIVAQSSRPHVPPEVLAVIQQHGVDTFLTKVARLPPESSLANQAGRNWTRKVGQALTEG